MLYYVSSVYYIHNSDIHSKFNFTFFKPFTGKNCDCHLKKKLIPPQDTL